VQNSITFSRGISWRMATRQYVPSSLGESAELRDQVAFDVLRTNEARAQKATKRREAANKKISMYAIYFCPADVGCDVACTSADERVR
jgi:hypothetical protein